MKTMAGLHAETKVLIEGWGLPPAAAPFVDKLVQGWERGDTALKLTNGEVALLQGCSAVGNGDLATPLVLADGLLQSWRFWAAERTVASRLKAMAALPLPPVPADLLATLAALEKTRGGLGKDQAKAVKVGLAQHLALVSGGPGTGKTHTAAYLLAARLQTHPDLRYALAAPTAKAARRLGQEIRDLAPKLPAGLAKAQDGLALADTRANTLHSWLGYNPSTGRCAHNADKPLDVDLVLVDEASMMDILQWRALLAALPENTSMVLMGDPHQLESVEVGNVLGVLVEAAAKEALPGCHASLDENFRFSRYPAIGQLAQAVLARDAKAVFAASPVANGDQPVAEGLRGPDPAAAVDRAWAGVQALVNASAPGEALKALHELRILCAVNAGPWGVSGLNAVVEARLEREGKRDWNRPVLILANDPHSGLNNGDLGVLLPGPNGATAWFDRGEGPRSYALSLLPRYDTAWAMSVHKCQGSEAREVVIVLPPEAKLKDKTRELVTTELLYTAVTRARERVVLCADEGAIGLACGKREERVTGLGKWLL